MVAVKGLFKITASYRAAYQKLSSSYDRFHSVVKNVQFQFSPFERTDFGQSAYNIRQPFFVFEIQPSRQSRNPRRRRMCLDEFHGRVKRRIKANRINSLRRNLGESVWTGPCSSTLCPVFRAMLIASQLFQFHPGQISPALSQVPRYTPRYVELLLVRDNFIRTIIARGNGSSCSLRFSLMGCPFDEIAAICLPICNVVLVTRLHRKYFSPSARSCFIQCNV